MNYIKTAFIAAVVVATFAGQAMACDLCPLCTSLGNKKPKEGSVRIGVSEQFTYYGSIQDNDKNVENLEHEHLAVSTTNFTGGYDLSDRVSFQATLPLVNKHYQRVASAGMESGDETGIGDVMLISKYALINRQECGNSMLFQVYGGVKLPTGDSDMLKAHSHAADEAMVEEDHEDMEDMHDDSAHEEEAMADEHEGHEHSLFRHAGEDHGDTTHASAVHGHDLALGSGSVDFPIGASFYAERDQVFISADVRYFIRTEGDHNYEYADDLMWSFGPGYYFVMEEAKNLALRAAFSGEHKGKDRSNGVKDDDTGMDAVYAGPELIFTSNNLSGEIGIDFPLDVNNSGYQLVPDYRIRAGLSYRF